MPPITTQAGAKRLSKSISDLTRSIKTYGSILCALGFSSESNPTVYTEDGRDSHGLLHSLEHSLKLKPDGAAIKAWAGQLRSRLENPIAGTDNIPRGSTMADVAMIISKFGRGVEMRECVSSESGRHTFEARCQEAKHTTCTSKCSSPICSTEDTQAEDGLMTLYLPLVVVDTGVKARGDKTPRWKVTAGETGGKAARVSWDKSQ